MLKDDLLKSLATGNNLTTDASHDDWLDTDSMRNVDVGGDATILRTHSAEHAPIVVSDKVTKIAKKVDIASQMTKKYIAEATKEVLGNKGFEAYVEQVMEHEKAGAPKESPYVLKEYDPLSTDKDQWIAEHKAEYLERMAAATKAAKKAGK
jgi:dissimilatory sulfite reductase (desulfoviridin) alpha/beta subunit